ncbi:predicted protein [Naegleria gruberi]|uniref:Predicted protein n=1 Tax=Naegleria gruberi TaxID=5762 RepID=D2W417_NAEGR|nr:uncharacterized protein NAEGRDRAFT_76147 [Naegleria gruberi]EFC36181.1 predicted protein [Naegleria gruberi]|eukprot:XP_002668925.1 predicted protein [Naegleria gruberi strain NEG-M]
MQQQEPTSHQVVFTPLQLPADLTPGTSYVEYQQNQWTTIMTNTTALVSKSLETEAKLQDNANLFNQINNSLFKLQKELDPNNVKTMKTQLVNIQQQLEKVIRMTESVEDLLIFMRAQTH